MSASEVMSSLFSTTYSVKATAVPLGDMLIALGLAFLLGLFIHLVYRKTFTGVMYSRSFSVSLIGLCMVTSMIILAVNSNVILSLSMVGALSIVRFRTAVKDPLDTAYMFWALTMGILLGAGQYFLTALTVVGIAALVFLLRRITGKSTDSYLLVMRLNGNGEAAIQQLMRQLRYQKLKSKTITAKGIEVTYEVRVEKSEAFLNKLLSLDGVSEASLVAYQAETV